MAVFAVGCGNSVDQARSDVTKLAESIQWPAGYEEPRSIDVADPSDASLDNHGGHVTLRFDYRGESAAELMDTFHQPLTDAGFYIEPTGASGTAAACV